MHIHELYERLSRRDETSTTFPSTCFLLATLTGASDFRARRSIKGFMREHPELVQSSGGRRKPLKKLASPLTVLPPVVTPLSAEVRSLYR